MTKTLNIPGACRPLEIDLEELEKLLKLPAVAGKVKLWGPKGSKPPKSAAEVVRRCLSDIKLIRQRSDSARRLWNVDRRLCIASTLRSDEMAAFLIEHIPADMLDEATK